LKRLWRTRPTGAVTADNPPFGAFFTYYLKDALKTKKENAAIPRRKRRRRAPPPRIPSAKSCARKTSLRTLVDELSRFEKDLEAAGAP
jgi:hypothetical protein